MKLVYQHENLAPKPGRQKRVVVFDLDGTLSNDDHRVNLLNKARMSLYWKTQLGAHKKDAEMLFEEYHSLGKQDKPNPLVFGILKPFIHSTLFETWILTSRPEIYAGQTLSWLEMALFPVKMVDKVIMRENGDTRRSWMIKSQHIMDTLGSKANVELIVDNDPTVIEQFSGHCQTLLYTQAPQV